MQVPKSNSKCPLVYTKLHLFLVATVTWSPFATRRFEKKQLEYRFFRCLTHVALSRFNLIKRKNTNLRIPDFQLAPVDNHTALYLNGLPPRNQIKRDMDRQSLTVIYFPVSHLSERYSEHVRTAALRVVV